METGDLRCIKTHLLFAVWVKVIGNIVFDYFLSEEDRYLCSSHRNKTKLGNLLGEDCLPCVGHPVVGRFCCCRLHFYPDHVKTSDVRTGVVTLIVTLIGSCHEIFLNKHVFLGVLEDGNESYFYILTSLGPWSDPLEHPLDLLLEGLLI